MAAALGIISGFASLASFRFSLVLISLKWLKYSDSMSTGSMDINITNKFRGHVQPLAYVKHMPYKHIASVTMGLTS